VIRFDTYIEKILFFLEQYATYFLVTHVWFCKTNAVSSISIFLMLDIINQFFLNIYVLPFEIMTIMRSCSFFINMNVKKFKLNIYLIKFLIYILIQDV